MNKTLIHQIQKKHTPEKIIETLTPYVTDARQQRINEVLENRLSSIAIAAESPADIHNALAIVRTSESFGVMDNYIISPESKAESVRSITQGAFQWVNIHDVNSLDSFLNIAKEKKYCLAGASLEGDTPLSEIPVDKPLCLIFGNEQRGLSAKAKKACDILYKIPMFGMTESFNLSVSAGISLYDVVSRKRKFLNQPGDLTAEELENYRAYYFLISVKERLVKGLF